MTYYIHEKEKDVFLLWKIEENSAIRVGVSNPKNSHGCYFLANHGESIWDCLKRLTNWHENGIFKNLHRIKLSEGEFYSRIARPPHHHPRDIITCPVTDSDLATIAISRSQLLALARQLDRICQTVHPIDKTFESYGHDIRNLLILSCTEVESQWRSILIANGVSKKNGRFNTEDYVKLVPAMRLNEYGVTFPSWPWLDAIFPFRKWRTAGKPTQDLEWYDAYNSVKHDRENSFSAATLRRALESVSACYIMLIAQYGRIFAIGHRSEIDSMFQIHSSPNWPIEDVYIFPSGGERWKSINFKF